jgi:hypothetical protein
VYAVDALQRVSHELPEARLIDFMSVANDELWKLWAQRNWKWFRKEVLTVPHTVFSNGTVTNGDATVTATDGAFTSDHVGAKIAVLLTGETTAVVVEIGAVTSATEVELTAVWAGSSQAGSVSLAVKQYRWPLASDFYRILAVGKRTAWSSGQSKTVPYESPAQYVLTALGAGSWVLDWVALPSAEDIAAIQYNRLPTLAVAPNSTVDLPVFLESAYHLGVLVRYLERLPAADYGLRMGRAAKAYREAVLAARRQEGGADRRRRVNDRVLI